MEKILLETPSEGFVDITGKVKEIVRKSSIKNGICQVFVSHTTAGITINENADPDVVSDMLAALDSLVPKLNYRHQEGNSRAHVKSSLVGCSLTVPVENGALVLGTWQGVYLCEFDGPRRRQVYVQVVGS